MLDKRIIVLGFLLCLLSSCKVDDEPSLDDPPLLENLSSFEKTYGGGDDDRFNSIVIIDQSLYAFGVTKSFGEPEGDYYLVKIDLDGELIWEKTFGGTRNDEGKKILFSKDGNLILIGSTYSIGNGLQDIEVIKVDLEGNLIWNTSLGGALDDTPVDIIETTGGLYCIAGTTESFGAGLRDIYLNWVDQLGNIVRSKSYGGSDIDGSAALLETENSNLMLFGYTNNFGAVNRDFYLMKLKSNGDSIWSKIYGGDGYEESQGITRTQDGNYMLSGHSASIDPLHDVYGVKINSEGDVIWEKHYGGSEHDGGQAFLIDANDRYVYVGRSDSFKGKDQDILVIVTDKDGLVLKEKNIGGIRLERADAIAETPFYYYIAGYTESYGEGRQDGFLIRMKKN